MTLECHTQSQVSSKIRDSAGTVPLPFRPLWSSGVSVPMEETE